LTSFQILPDVIVEPAANPNVNADSSESDDESFDPTYIDELNEEERSAVATEVDSSSTCFNEHCPGGGASFYKMRKCGCIVCNVCFMTETCANCFEYLLAPTAASTPPTAASTAPTAHAPTPAPAPTASAAPSPAALAERQALMASLQARLVTATAAVDARRPASSPSPAPAPAPAAPAPAPTLAAPAAPTPALAPSNALAGQVVIGACASGAIYGPASAPASAPTPSLIVPGSEFEMDLDASLLSEEMECFSPWLGGDSTIPPQQQQDTEMGEEKDEDEEMDDDDKRQAEFEGAGAGGGSSSIIEQRLIEGQSAKCRASLMRRCMDPDASAFATTTAVQTAIEGVQELMRQGLDLMERLGRLNELNKRKDELLVSEVRARRERTREERKAEEEDNQSDAASSNPRDSKRR
jgi:hypothetical protein